MRKRQKRYFTFPYAGWSIWSSPPGMPNHNQALEEFNKALKDYCTHWRSLNFSALVSSLCMYLTQLSASGSHGSVPLTPGQIPPTSNMYLRGRVLRTYMRASEWLTTKASIPVQMFDVGVTKRIFIYISARLLASPADIARATRPLDLHTLSDFCFLYSIKRVVGVVPTADGAYDAICNCPWYGKYALCKHNVGTLLRLGHLTLPPECDQRVLRPNSKPGRPKQIRSVASSQPYLPPVFTPEEGDATLALVTVVTKLTDTLQLQLSTSP